jgi:CheY-like chemotaxis protein
MMTDKRIINALLIEDELTDAELIRNAIAEENDVQVVIRHADRLSLAIDFLKKVQFDVILSDLSLPDSSGIDTFDKVYELAPKIPIIVLTGNDDVSMGLEAVHKGAQGYFSKGQISCKHLLGRAILYSIERQGLHIWLEKRMDEINTLRDLIPVCARCKKMRDEKGYWLDVEQYLTEHSDATFIHGMCDNCSSKASSEWKQAVSESLKLIKKDRM